MSEKHPSSQHPPVEEPSGSLSAMVVDPVNSIDDLFQQWKEKTSWKFNSAKDVIAIMHSDTCSHCCGYVKYLIKAADNHNFSFSPDDIEVGIRTAWPELIWDIEGVAHADVPHMKRELDEA